MRWWPAPAAAGWSLARQQALEQLDKRPALSRRERGEELLLPPEDDHAGFVEPFPARGGHLERVSAAVVRVAPALDVAGLLEPVYDRHHRRPVEGGPFAETLLGERSLGRDHCKTAEVLAGEPGREGRIDRLVEVPVGLAEQEPKPFGDRRRQLPVALDAAGLPLGTGVRTPSSLPGVSGPVLHGADYATFMIVMATEGQRP